MHKLLTIFIIASMAMAACSGKKSSAGLELNKDNFKPGEEIVVTYTAPADFAKDAWIGVIASTVKHGDEAENDKFDLAYKYLNNSTSGKMTFNAPNNPGPYDIRMHDTDANGKEVASVSFSVEGLQAKEKSDEGKFKVGEPVLVKWGKKWWNAKVIAAGKKKWKITYDGYDSSWDEWVGPDRIKKK